MDGQYLIVRSGTYYFKRSVPAKLVGIIGRKLWRETLKATSLPDAIQAVAPHIDHTNIEIRLARQELHRQRGAAVMLTPNERAIVDEHGGFGGLRTDTRSTSKQLVFAEAATDMLATLATHPRPALAREGVSLDDLQAELAEAEAYAKTLRKQVERNRSIITRAGLKPSETLADDDLPESDDAAADMTLSALTELFVKDLTQQHADQYRYPARLFVEFHSSSLIQTIDKAKIRDWRDALGKLPRSTNKEYRSATMRHAIAMAEKNKADRITPQTVAKHLAALKTLFKFAIGEGYLLTNPAEGLTVKVAKGKKSGARRRISFNPAQLKTLFDTLNAETKIEDDDRWIPHVAIFQGMRLEEVSQLAKADLIKDADADIWLIRITDEGDGQTVKSAASVRTVPLHPELIARGFLDHVKRSRGPQVFANFKADNRGRLGGQYGKRFARLLRDKASIKDRRVVFHSLRHTWVDAARAVEMPTAVRLALGGWSEGSADGGNPVAEGYGSNGIPVEVLAKWLGRVNPFSNVAPSATI